MDTAPTWHGLWMSINVLLSRFPLEHLKIPKQRFYKQTCACCLFKSFGNLWTFHINILFSWFPATGFLCETTTWFSHPSLDLLLASWAIDLTGEDPIRWFDSQVDRSLFHQSMYPQNGSESMWAHKLNRKCWVERQQTEGKTSRNISSNEKG